MTKKLDAPIDFYFWVALINLGTLLIVVTPQVLTFAPTQAKVEASEVVDKGDDGQRFLELIKYAEGSKYNVMFGGKTFNDFSDHPRQLQTVMSNGQPLTSDAAGLCQWLSTTWDEYAKKAGVSDFSEASQDKACLLLLEDIGVIEALKAGDFKLAVNRAARRFASLPDETGRSYYGQPVKSIEELRKVWGK